MKRLLFWCLLAIPLFSFSQKVSRVPIYSNETIVREQIGVEDFLIESNYRQEILKTSNTRCFENRYLTFLNMFYQFDYIQDGVLGGISFTLSNDLKSVNSKNETLLLKNVLISARTNRGVINYYGDILIKKLLLKEKGDFNRNTFYFRINYTDDMGKKVYWNINY